MKFVIGLALICAAKAKHYYREAGACAILAAIIASYPIYLQNRLMDWLLTPDTSVEACIDRYLDNRTPRDDASFRILFTELAGDADTKESRRIVRNSLETLFDRADRAIRIEFVPCVLQLDGAGELSETRAANDARASNLAKRAASDVVIYGEAFRDRIELLLAIPSLESSRPGITYDIIDDDRRLVLSNDFGFDVGAIITAKAISLTVTTATEEAQFLLPIMRSSVNILDPLAKNLPNGLSRIDQAWLLASAGMANYWIGSQAGTNSELESSILYLNSAAELALSLGRKVEYVHFQVQLGNSLATLGERESGGTRLEQAILAYTSALGEQSPDRTPKNWAVTQSNLGTVLLALGERESGTARLHQAIQAFSAALTEQTREQTPWGWALTKSNLGIALLRIGQRENNREQLEQAVEEFTAALSVLTREVTPLSWAATQNNLGATLQTLSAQESGTSRLKQAIQAYSAALSEWKVERVPLDWALTQTNLGALHWALFLKTGDMALLDISEAHLRAAAEVFKNLGARRYLIVAVTNLAMVVERRHQPVP